MSPQSGDDGIFKIAVRVQLPVFFLHRKLVHASAITSKAPSNNRPRVAVRQLCGTHMNPSHSPAPFHPLVS